MKLYEIDEQLEQLIDPETGEILDFNAFDNLMMQRDEKIENVALWIKNLKAEAKALKEEKDMFAQRERVVNKKIERLTFFLTQALNGSRFHTDRVSISWRKSKATVLDSRFYEWAAMEGDDYLRYSQPEADISKIRTALEAGIHVPFAEIVERNNIQIR